jgi:hypothetical protein
VRPLSAAIAVPGSLVVVGTDCRRQTVDGGPCFRPLLPEKAAKLPDAASIPYSIPWTLTLKPSVSSSRPQINSIAAFAAVARLSWARGGDSMDGMAVPLGNRPSPLAFSGLSAVFFRVNFLV